MASDEAEISELIRTINPLMEKLCSKAKVRYAAIDYAKAILIILMIVGHISCYPDFDGFFGSFHMGAFLFIAGLFCKKKEVPIKQVLESSFYQLLIPYAIFSFIAFAWCWVSPYLHPELYPDISGFFGILKAALIGAVLGQDIVTTFSFMPNSPLWFLLGLFWCRMFSLVWLKSDNKYYNIGKIIIVALCLLIYRYDLTVFSLRSAAVCFPFYISGFYMKNTVFSFSKLNKYVSLIIASVAFAIVFILDDYRIYYDAGRFLDLNNYSSAGLQSIFLGGILLVFSYIRGFAGAFGLLVLCFVLEKTDFDKSKKLLNYVGRSTLVILGTHILFVIIFKIIYASLGGNPGNVTFIVSIIASCFIALIGAVIYHYVEIKYPLVVGKRTILIKKNG